MTLTECLTISPSTIPLPPIPTPNQPTHDKSPVANTICSRTSSDALTFLSHSGHLLWCGLIAFRRWQVGEGVVQGGGRGAVMWRQWRWRV